MFRQFCRALAACLVLTSPLAAEDRLPLGYGRLSTNDLFAEGRDRWQTGSVASSRVRGPDWTGHAPDAPGALLEYRLGFHVMSPSNLRNPAPGDRPLATAISLGLHTHFTRGAAEIALGGDLVVTGPQTGLDDFQTALHDAIGIAPPSPGVKDRQIGNGVHPSFVGEIGQDIAWGGARLRPFAEARWGAETLVRLGADLTLGVVGQGELLVRDPVTGQRYRAVQTDAPGSSFVLGGDIAYVDSSIFLPESRGYALTDSRQRLRAGVHWQGERHSAFYGLTWLGEEFDGQPNGQVVGSLRLKLAF
ncbi:lipid A-modifier LpxR family protein [Aestuariicoccus sp. MJ-SS9]|uniref:lipid A-modifier LpxR family protein n=1 Tax=Aestuariicoccus sp. MJ-SS9 TaxID=3079855 RepID=UPI002910BBAF|nr:lipid A-modifier LpxR family protein [Aestuariicoccus sp. MJ-SS9]MDU8912395.1 DUF2219 family protein [Aestuariicoccus sp. MJ-SS9]